MIPTAVATNPVSAALKAVEVRVRTLVISRVSSTADRKRRRSHLVNMFSLE